jgi:hypothetical protein
VIRPPARLLTIVAATALAGLAHSGAAQAQSPAADVCAGLATQAEEIACLRGALQESRAAVARERKPSGPPSATPAAPPHAAELRQVAPEQLGAEQVASSRRPPAETQPEQEQVRAVAEAVRTDHLGLVTLRLDNGQVWQQAEARGVPLRLRADRQYAVEISPSGFGGYRMHFTDTGRQIVVRRLQ